MIRVAVCQWFPPTLWCPGGGEVHSEQYINYLNQQEGVEAFRFCPVTNQNFDILHVLGTNYHLNEIGKYARLADIKVVLTPIVYNPRHPYQFKFFLALFNSLRVKTLIGARKEILENTDIILANTYIERKFIQKAFGIDAEQIHVVGIGVSVNEYQKIDAALFKEKYGLNDYVLSVGRVTPLKRQLNILDAVKTLGVTPVLIGPPDKNNMDYVRKVECRLSEANGLWIKGIPHGSPELLSAYRGSLCHILFSTSETAGLVNIEALCAGTVAVTFPHETVKEILKEHGFYVSSVKELKNKIESIAMLSEIDRNHFIKKGKEYVFQNLSWEKVAKDTVHIYKRILGRK